MSLNNCGDCVYLEPAPFEQLFWSHKGGWGLNESNIEMIMMTIMMKNAAYKFKPKHIHEKKDNFCDSFSMAHWHHDFISRYLSPSVPAD